MPTRPRSHAQRQGRSASDRTYDQAVRTTTPALARAKQVRSSARWRRVRALKLAESPVCEDIYGMHAAQGRVEIARQVDHVQSLAQGGAAFDMHNLQSLCFQCHSRKSQSERRLES